MLEDAAAQHDLPEEFSFTPKRDFPKALVALLTPLKGVLLAVAQHGLEALFDWGLSRLQQGFRSPRSFPPRPKPAYRRKGKGRRAAGRAGVDRVPPGQIQDIP